MSPSHVLEPTYQRLKRELMFGRWPQDTRLEAMRIADDYGVSATPVRDCLNRLTGEGLVTMRPGEGYRVPRLTEKGVRDLLELHKLLVAHTLPRGCGPTIGDRDPKIGSGYAEAVSALFIGIAEGSGNSALVFVIRAIGERMYPIRRLEPALLGGTDQELERLRHSAEERRADLGERIAAYHDRRADHVPALVAALP